MTPYLLFDVGGTDIKSALCSAEGKLLTVQRAPTMLSATDPAGALVGQLNVLGTGLMERSGLSEPAAVGLLVCGVVDEDSGQVVFSSNLGLRDAPVRDLASSAFGLPVGFGHDVSMAGAAELQLGVGTSLGSRVKNCVTIVIGTGIAAALFVDGRPVSSGGFAGELGHASVPGGLDCACGAHGCLETIGSAGAIARRYSLATGTPNVGAREVLAAKKQGDPVAGRIWDEAIEAIAYSIAQLCASIAPEAIVIGGGLSQAGDDLLEPLRKALTSRLSYHRNPVIVPAQLGQDAGLYGAYLKAREVDSQLP